MRVSFKASFLTIVLAAAFQLVGAGNAFAHYPLISASAACDQQAGVYKISYSVGSHYSTFPGAVQAPSIGGSIADLDVLFGNIKVADISLTLPTNTASGSANSPTGPGTTVNVTAQANGLWGDGQPSSSATATVAVNIPNEPCGEDVVPGVGRFTGGGKQIDAGGVSITNGLTLHCDLKLSNNLEINWNKGENFHLTQHTSAICTDSESIEQKPPVAPLDTMVGTGIGKYNNKDGYSVQFTLIDAGEPGRDDQIQIKIFETANPANVVLNLPLTFLTGGNLQAHYDQPHKK